VDDRWIPETVAGESAAMPVAGQRGGPEHGAVAGCIGAAGGPGAADGGRSRPGGSAPPMSGNRARYRRIPQL